MAAGIAFDPGLDVSFVVVSSRGDDLLVGIHMYAFVEVDRRFGLDFGFTRWLFARRIRIGNL
jgi:hypothetical protein